MYGHTDQLQDGHLELYAYNKVLEWLGVHNKGALPIHLGNDKGLCENPLFPGPTSVVSLESIKLIFEAIATFQVFINYTS